MLDSVRVFKQYLNVTVAYCKNSLNTYDYDPLEAFLLYFNHKSISRKKSDDWENNFLKIP